MNIYMEGSRKVVHPISAFATASTFVILNMDTLGFVPKRCLSLAGYAQHQDITHAFCLRIRAWLTTEETSQCILDAIH